MPIIDSGRHNDCRESFLRRRSGLVCRTCCSHRSRFAIDLNVEKEMLYPMSPLANWSSELRTSRIGWQKLPTNAKQTK
jgi:hypothetical protein